MAHEVIMPALGMVQESGTIVSWLKAPGDAVKSGEALMEVETDKAVMAVEAQADGFLTGVCASEGDDVPVGQVIALISDSIELDDDAPSGAEKHRSVPAARGTGGNDEEIVPNRSKDGASAAQPWEVASLTAGERILASPKAKRLAAEQGLDLRRLVSAGHAQPFRSTDVEALAQMHGLSAGEARSTMARALLPETAYQRFLNVLAAEGDIPARNVIAAFAAGALRSATGCENAAVRVMTPRLGDSTYINPDRSPISDIEEQNIASPDLTVVDLRQSRITQLELSASRGPVVSISRDAGQIVIQLAATSDSMDELTLVACLDDLAGRFEEPLRHLL